MKTVPTIYNLLLNTIYLSQSTQVAEGTVFRKHAVPGGCDQAGGEEGGEGVHAENWKNKIVENSDTTELTLIFVVLNNKNIKIHQIRREKKV